MTFTLFKKKDIPVATAADATAKLLMALKYSKACEYLVAFYKEEPDDIYVEALIHNANKFWESIGTPKLVTKTQVLRELGEKG